MQGIDRYIWLVGQIISEPSLKELLSKDQGPEPSLDQDIAEPRTPDFSGYASSEVIITNVLFIEFFFRSILNLKAHGQTFATYVVSADAWIWMAGLQWLRNLGLICLKIQLHFCALSVDACFCF